MKLLHRLHIFLRLNILAGGLVFAGLSLYPVVAGTPGSLHLNAAVVALFYSYLFWLAEIFSRPVAGVGQAPGGRRSGSV